MSLDEIRNSSFTILGAGRSGIAIARLLKKAGAKVLLSDSNPTEELTYLDTGLLEKEGIEYETAGHTEKVYENDVFIKSPGIPPDSEVIVEAVKRGKKIVSEIEAGYWFCDAPIIAITGTNGKTTTTVLTGEILKNAGMDIKVCGNVGLAFSEIVSEVKKESVVVLEVSSFQLENIGEFKPKISAFLNFKEDHLDWHKTKENYLNAKMKITMNQDENDVFIYNVDDADITDRLAEVKARKAGFGLEKGNNNEGCYLENETIFYFNSGMSEPIINTNEIFIKGLHNVYNSMAAILASKEFNVSNEVIKKTLRSFKGIEHRIEFVKEIDGIKFYNDSKATNIESTKMALSSFNKNIILILGGYGSANLDELKDLIKERVKKIIAVGQSREIIYETFKNIVETEVCDSFDVGIMSGFQSAIEGDVVLLSPAYKSFDMFNNFEERGKEFKRIVNSLNQ